MTGSAMQELADTFERLSQTRTNMEKNRTQMLSYLRGQLVLCQKERGILAELAASERATNAVRVEAEAEAEQASVRRDLILLLLLCAYEPHDQWPGAPTSENVGSLLRENEEEVEALGADAERVAAALYNLVRERAVQAMGGE